MNLVLYLIASSIYFSTLWTALGPVLCSGIVRSAKFRGFSQSIDLHQQTDDIMDPPPYLVCIPFFSTRVRELM